MMENNRLTESVRWDENYQLKVCGNMCCDEICSENEDCGKCPIGRAINKLAKYEDIGTVEEFKDLEVKNSELHNEIQAERALLNERDKAIRNKAIDEFAKKLKSEYENCTGIPNTIIKFLKLFIEQIAEQMKGGAE